MITGFGRLGHAFAAERYGVIPDMICFAKGVTNGAAALGGVMVRGRIHTPSCKGLSMCPSLPMASPIRGIRSASPRRMPRSTSIATRACSSGPARSSPSSPIDGSPGLRGARAYEAAFFDEDLVIRAVGDTLVLAPALIASEADIGAIVERIERILAALR